MTSMMSDEEDHGFMTSTSSCCGSSTTSHCDSSSASSFLEDDILSNPDLIDEDHRILVIGAGLPRTGTNSTQLALQELLGERCHHGFTFVEESKASDLKFWRKVLERRVSIREIQRYFRQRPFRAGVDVPFSTFYKDLLLAFPNAKVILTTRDPDSWYRSCQATILPGFAACRTIAAFFLTFLTRQTELDKLIRAFSDVVPRGFDCSLSSALMGGRDDAIEFFNKWNEEVRRTVPRENLLEFDVRQGWQPLCDFLDKPVPDTPFPRVNASAELSDRIRKFHIMSWSVTIALPAIVGLATFKIIKATSPMLFSGFKV